MGRNVRPDATPPATGTAKTISHAHPLEVLAFPGLLARCRRGAFP
jgi:hypothetical protein